MSGLCGLWRRDTEPGDGAVTCLVEQLKLLTRAAPHRGSALTHSDKATGFAALDTGTNGSSLASHPFGMVVAQSRLDNRDDLVPRLRNYAAAPTSSDAELILAAYRCWGTDAPEHLLGDFAFALWDAAEQQLFAARDPLAMRPFYYYADAERFCFASEIKQLLALPDVPKRIDETAVALYLAGRYDPLDYTFYEEIKQLEPAHALLATAKGVRTWRYWDIDPERQLRYRRDEDYSEHFRHLFLQAVTDRLRTERPIGLFLSGGVDSGTLASAIGWLEQSGLCVPDIHAVSFAFGAFPECDEREVSDAIAAHYGFETHTVDMNRFYPLARYPEHGPEVDEPFIGAYQAALEGGMAQAQALGVGLMMGGDRGDLLAGDFLFDPLGMLRAGRWGLAAHELGALRSQKGNLRRALWQDLVKPVALGFRERYYRLVSNHAVTHLPPWLAPALVKRTDLKNRLLTLPVAAPFGGIRGLRYEHFLMPFHMRGMVWSERSQAKFGLEFTDAFSDRRLLEFVLSIPQWQVQRTDAPKHIVQRALEPTLPATVRGKLRKVYPSPLYEAALHDYARTLITELLSEPQAEALGYLDAGALRTAYERMVEGEDVPDLFWEALTLEMWLRRYWS